MRGIYLEKKVQPRCWPDERLHHLGWSQTRTPDQHLGERQRANACAYLLQPRGAKENGVNIMEVPHFGML